MAVLTWIIIGLLAGWIAHGLVGKRGGILNNLAVGLLGGVVGGFLFRHISVAERPGFFGSLVTAAIGAILLLVVWRLVWRGR
jgi:uncharacterized membrane protein YeaQ/YmgE (transglycosylase-associated protein family)